MLVRSSEKRGAVVIFLATYILALIGMVGLAVQSGYLYLSRGLLQSALDAGAVKGASLMLSNHTDAAAKAAAEAIAVFNISLNRDETIVPGPASTASSSFIEAFITDPGARVRVDGRLRRPVFFINALPGIPSFTKVSATSSAANSPLSIVFILDHSYSMQQNTIPMGPPWPPNNSRFYWATLVLRDYITPLLQIGDQVSLIRYSTGTSTIPTLNVYPNTGLSYSLSPVINRYTKASTISSMQSEISSIPIPSPNNWTNTPSGLLAAAQAISSTTAPGALRRKLVVLITDGAAALVGTDLQNAVEPLSACEQTIPEFAAGERYHRVFFNRTIAAADSLRQLGALVHSIAFTSNLSGIDTNASSPYQNMTNGTVGVGTWAQLIKPLLLMRLANMQGWLYAPPPPFNSSSNPYPYDFPCTPAGSTLASAPSGQYVYSFDPTQLATALSGMLNTARVKLEG